MVAKSVGFAVAEEDLPLLEQLVDQFGGGNRSEFLRVAMRRLHHEAWAEKTRALQSETREALAGRVYTTEEVVQLVKDAASGS